jgi:integrase
MARPPKNALAFNHRSLQALKSSADQIDYMCLGFEGFGIRVYPSGRKAFFVRYRRGGLRRFNLGNFPAVSLREARAKAESILGHVAEGDDPQADRKEALGALTFGELAASFLEKHSKHRKRSWKEDERILNRELLPEWGKLSAAAIRRRDVAWLLDKIASRPAPIMANRVRALVSRIFRYGVEREIVEFNPVTGTAAPGEERKRARVFSEEEIRTLWAIWEREGSVTSAAFRMLLLTGQRLNEVLSMRWADLSGAWWTLPPAATKNKRGHRVYLSRQALALLEGLPRRREWVFASPRTEKNVTSLNVATARFRAASGIANWSVHDLRRTVATHMGRKPLSIPRQVIGFVLGHVDGGVTAIYDRAEREPEIENALRAWGQQLEELLGDKHATKKPERDGGGPDLGILVGHLLNFERAAATRWVAEAERAKVDWHKVPPPTSADAKVCAVAASIAELLASRADQPAPSWTAGVGSAPAPLFLVEGVASRRRLRILCEREGPEPLRRRRIFAPPNFLVVDEEG